MASKWRKMAGYEPEYYEHLARVTTIREVMKLYEIESHTSIRVLVQKGDIVATKVCGVWILSMDSVIDWYGKPKLANIEKLAS